MATRAVGATQVALIGFWFAWLTERMVRRALLAYANIDPMVSGFISNFARYTVLLLTSSFSSCWHLSDLPRSLLHVRLPGSSRRHLQLE